MDFEKVKDVNFIGIRIVYVQHDYTFAWKRLRMRWAGPVAPMGERRGVKVFGGKPEGERLLGRPRFRW
jgi:hypothetical protein